MLRQLYMMSKTSPNSYQANGGYSKEKRTAGSRGGEEVKHGCGQRSKRALTRQAHTLNGADGRRSRRALTRKARPSSDVSGGHQAFTSRSEHGAGPWEDFPQQPV